MNLDERAQSSTQPGGGHAERDTDLTLTGLSPAAGRAVAAATRCGPAAPPWRSSSSAGARTRSRRSIAATLSTSRIVDQPTMSEPSGVSGPVGPAADAGDEHIEPGTYRVLVGADASGGEIEADLTVEGPGWNGGNFPTAAGGRDATAASASTGPTRSRPGPGATTTLRTPTWVRARRPSRSSSPQLPGSTVVQPVTADASCSATTPSTCGWRSPTTAPRTAVLPRRGDAARQSRHQLQRRAQDGRHGLLGPGRWTGSRSWSTRGTRTARRPTWWTGSPRRATPSASLASRAGHASGAS